MDVKVKEAKKKTKIKEEVKKRGGSASEQKKQRKVYDLPGQKRDPPEEVCHSFHIFTTATSF